MSAAARIAFFASGGGREGLGHVLRCAALAREALDAGLAVGFSLAGDDAARQRLSEELPGLAIECWVDASLPPVDASWAVFDTRRPLEHALCSARAAGVRSLVLDRIDCAERADLTILPVLHLPPSRHPRVRQGARYCVIADVVRRALPCSGFESRRNVLVSLGGADPWRASRGVADALVGLIEEGASGVRSREVDFVLGPAFGARPALEHAIEEYGWRLHRAPSRAVFAALLARARLAVLGFGTTLYEAAYLGTPALWLTHHAEDVAHALRLEHAGFGRFGAQAQLAGSARLRALLRTLVEDGAWARRASRAGRALLGDGRGAARIVEVLRPAGGQRRDAVRVPVPVDWGGVI